MTVNRYATQAGKRYETELMNYLRAAGHDVERLRLTGAEDEGDLLMRTPFNRYVIEAKRRKGLDLAGWVKEAQVERLNYMKHRGILGMEAPTFVVIHYARSKGVGGSYVTTTLDEWLGL